MDAIRSYLESMFARLPNTEDVRKAKSELLQMMEDKYAELLAEGKSENEAVGTVISEFGNLDELADSLGIGNVVHGPSRSGGERRTLTLAQVKDYLSDAGKAAHCTALGVLLCIVCCVPVIVLSAFSDRGLLSEVAADAVGVSMLFLFVAAGVTLFVQAGARRRSWRFLDEEPCGIDVSGAEYVLSQKKAYAPTYNVCLSLGIVLCILCVVPVSVAGILERGDSFWETVMSALLFVLVALGVFLLVSSAQKNKSFAKLLGLNDASTMAGQYAREGSASSGNRTVAVIMGVYWPAVTCSYLIWSFASGAWHITWVVWAVAGCVAALIKALFGSSGGSADESPAGRGGAGAPSGKGDLKLKDVYWPTVTCGYLIWSFLSFDWHITWVVWPVAAVVATLIRNIYGTDE